MAAAVGCERTEEVATAAAGDGEQTSDGLRRMSKRRPAARGGSEWEQAKLAGSRRRLSAGCTGPRRLRPRDSGRSGRRLRYNQPLRIRPSLRKDLYITPSSAPLSLHGPLLPLRLASSSATRRHPSASLIPTARSTHNTRATRTTVHRASVAGCSSSIAAG